VVKVSPTISNNTVNAAGAVGVYLFISYLTYGVFESDLTISGNSFTGTDDGIALSLEGFSDGTGFDGNWLIANNTISNPGSYGIFVSLNSMSVSTSSGTWDLTVSGNTITNAGSDGMYLLPAYSWYSSAEINQTILIQGNTVTGSGGDGIYLYMSDQTGLLSNDVQITDNVIHNNGDDGLDIYSADWNASPNYTGNAVLVSCNTITGNTANGVYQNGGTGTSYDPPADYGGGNLGSPGNNTIRDNLGYDFYNDDDDDVSAENNWWGSTVPAIIDGKIYGTVDYDPFLLAANSPTITASLVGSVAVDVPPTGPSIGDTFLYTLTVDSSGACGDVDLDFACPVPANTTVVGGSVTTTQGVVGSDDPVEVTIGHVAAGDTATITWQVGVDSGTQVVTQGTLNGVLIGAVLSDDPSQPGASDPTVMTLIVLAPGGVQFDSATYTVLENAGSVTLTVNRTGGIDGAVSIDFDTVDGTAVAGTDYTATSGTLNWADLDGTPKTIVVPIIDNAATDGSRTFDVALSNALGGAVLGLPDTATVTIQDDEAAASAAIPTLGEWGLMFFIGLMLLAGFMLLRRRELPAALLLVGLALAPAASAATADRDLEKRDRKNTSVTTVESVEVHGDHVTLRLADGSVVTARDKAFHFRDGREKQWRTENLTKEQRRGIRDSEQVKAERAARRQAKLDAKATGTKNVRRKDQRRANGLTLKSLPAGQPVLVSVERDRDGTVRKVRIQAVASVENTQRMVDDRRQRKLERAAKRALDNN
jgi:parallel beta-helix repeat protein